MECCLLLAVTHFHTWTDHRYISNGYTYLYSYKGTDPFFVDNVVANVLTAFEYLRAEGVAEELLRLRVWHVQC